MRFPRLAVLVALLALALPALAAARTIGSGSGSGKRAQGAATADITRPRLVAVRVTSRPAQRASGKWTVVCKGLHGRKGTLAGRGRFTKVLGLPRGKRTSCFVVVSARLAGTGRISVALLGH